MSSKAGLRESRAISGENARPQGTADARSPTRRHAETSAVRNEALVERDSVGCGRWREQQLGTDPTGMLKAVSASNGPPVSPVDWSEYQRIRPTRVETSFVALRLLTFRPRDANYTGLELKGISPTRWLLSFLPRHQRLLGAAAAGPALWRAIVKSFDDDPDAFALCAFLREPFPPATLAKACASWIVPLRKLALGNPGDAVPHGVSPSRATKLARILLSLWAVYPPDLVRDAARTAYCRSRPYHAHDAVACALVHPDVDAASILESHLSDGRRERGAKSRKKTWQLRRWASFHGLVSTVLENTSD